MFDLEKVQYASDAENNLYQVTNIVEHNHLTDMYPIDDDHNIIGEKFRTFDLNDYTLYDNKGNVLREPVLDEDEDEESNKTSNRRPYRANTRTSAADRKSLRSVQEDAAQLGLFVYGNSNNLFKISKEKGSYFSIRSIYTAHSLLEVDAFLTGYAQAKS